MSFKTDYQKYCKAHTMADEASNNIMNFFREFDLDYSLTYAAGDGVMLLEYISGRCARLNNNDISELSNAKSKEEIMKVIGSLNFLI